MAQTVATFHFRLGNFYDGTPESMAQYLHANAFTKEWSTKDGEDDKYYDPQYSSSNYEGTLLDKGIVLNADGTWTQYYDYNFPGDVARVASRCAPTGNPGSTAGIIVTWYVAEALSRLVAGGAEGNPSGTPYNFEGNSTNEVDVLVENHVKDIRAEFEEMVAEKYVPECLKDFITVEDALTAYANAIAFIDAHGHAYISNGPFYINKLDRANSYIELAANRDESYPFTSQEWVDLFAVPMINIDKVTMPSLVPAGKDFEVKVKLSKMIYPSITPERADEGTVEVRILAAEEIVVSGQVTNTGDFKLVIPGSLTQNLAAGTYDVMVQAELEGAVPVSLMKSIVVW
jgi:peptide/nickel transport system substrate-binding protein